MSLSDEDLDRIEAAAHDFGGAWPVMASDALALVAEVRRLRATSDPVRAAKAVAWSTYLSEREASNLLLVLSGHGFRLVPPTVDAERGTHE